MNQKQTLQFVEAEAKSFVEDLIQKYALPLKKTRSSGLSGILQGYPRKILSVALAIVILMGFFPPWVSVFKTSKLYSKQPLGYSLIFAPPSPPDVSRAYGVGIDYPRLFLQWIIILLIAGLGVLFAGSKKDIEPLEKLIQLEIERLILEKAKIQAEIKKLESDAMIEKAKAVAEMRAKYLKP